MIYCISENDIENYKIKDIITIIEIIFKDYILIVEGLKEIIMKGGDYEKSENLLKFLRLTNEDNLKGKINQEVEKYIIEDFLKLIKKYRSTLSLMNHTKIDNNEEIKENTKEIDNIIKEFDNFIY